MDNHYRVGNIAICMAPSTDNDWERRLKVRMLRQLDGFQAREFTSTETTYTLNIRDYARLPIELMTAARVVPDYCFFDNCIYADSQQKAAIHMTETSLDYWCDGVHGRLSMPFLLQQLLLQQYKTFVHAGAISVDGVGILLPAFGGIGKTSFIATAAQDPRVQILGDDMVILDRQGRIEPYLRPFALFAYHRSLFPKYFEENLIKHKPLTLSWRIYNKIRRTLSNRFAIPWQQTSGNVIRGHDYLPVAPYHILPAHSLSRNAVPFRRLYLLVRDGKTDQITTHPLDREQAITFLLDVLYHEWYSQLRFLHSWLAHRDVSIRAYYQQVEDILRQATSIVTSIHLVSIPLDIKPSVLGERLCDLIL